MSLQDFGEQISQFQRYDLVPIVERELENEGIHLINKEELIIEVLMRNDLDVKTSIDQLLGTLDNPDENEIQFSF